MDHHAISEYRTWLEVETKAIKRNAHAMKGTLAEKTRFMAVIKGNAWGLGTLACARTLHESGVDWFGVTTVADLALLLREIPEVKALLLCEPPLGALPKALSTGGRLTIASLETAVMVSRLCVEMGLEVRVHLKINTGLNRLGVSPANSLDFAHRVSQLPGLIPEGAFTHFSSADHLSCLDLTKAQLASFLAAAAPLKNHGFSLLHAANSPACLSLPDSHLDMVRVGMALMGLYPGPDFYGVVSLQSPLTWKTRIAQVHKLDQGEKVGYGGKFVCTHHTVLATLSVGYADGLPKRFLHKGQVLIRGDAHPLVAVSMDMAMVDLGCETVDWTVGEEVVILGRQGANYLDPQEVALANNTDLEELLCGVNTRVPRVYF